MPLSRIILLALVAVAAAPAYAGEKPATVRVLSCSPWQEGLGGTVTYESRMRKIPDASRMAVSFALLERIVGSPFQRVTTSGMNKSRRGAGTFKWQHKFEGLRLGAVYRARVRFRWYAEDGTLLRSETQKSARCEQPGDHPNLRIRRIELAEGEVEGAARYDVTVVNRGLAEATTVGVGLRVDGQLVDEADGAIEALRPGESRTVSFSGPVCRRRVRAVVDPRDTIAESRENDNVRAVRCV